MALPGSIPAGRMALRGATNLDRSPFGNGSSVAPARLRQIPKSRRHGSDFRRVFAEKAGINALW